MKMDCKDCQNYSARCVAVCAAECINYKPKPAPGQPCPACGQPVPEQENPPPAPFKVGDWIECGSSAFLVGKVEYRGNTWLWGVGDTASWVCKGWRVLRPALPPLPQDVKDLAADVLRIPDGYASCRVATARFLRDLYPHEFGGR